MASEFELQYAVPIDFNKKFVQIIDGVPSPTKGKRRIANPATRVLNPEVPIATPKHIAHAVEVARKTVETWSKIPNEARPRIMLAFADAVNIHRDSFSDLIVREQGKPRDQALTEVNQAIEWIREMSRFRLGDETIEDGDHYTVKTRYLPLGVVVATYLSWDFPMLNCVANITPALLTGNVVIVNPCPFAPYCGLKLVELAQSFFPPGVVQSLSGETGLVEVLAHQPNIDKISFSRDAQTGKDSLPVALNLISRTQKRDITALGGNDPAIVFPDVDIEQTAEKVAYHAFLNSGQLSHNIKRIYVHESIFEEFKAALMKVVKAYKLGDGSQAQTTHGPIQNGVHYERVKSLLRHIKNEEWKIAVGGEIDPSLKPGYFFPLTVIDRPPKHSHIVREEKIGPIATLHSWNSEEDVIAEANNSKPRLGASIWTNNLDKASQFAAEMKADTVWVNTHFDLWPLSGHKEGNLGSKWGLNGLKGFCNAQNFILNKSPASIQPGSPRIDDEGAILDLVESNEPST
ncbi:aldehyde dehydrogenase [Penicillium malachiteum]|uniref:aldehyde dehydrogenase (NAD(+)) n=1 Tax=Penicillium malachiteum TaxID=1324776 RepID=A0AAD6MSF7_9EURO|nr:aldehyde dehydrogenase [Penicillium malachiteum]